MGYVNSIQAYWSKALRGYTVVPTVFFTGHTRSGCGPASSQVGPFYCPRDKRVYIDLGFLFSELQSQFGAKGGPFAEAYVLAHEYGHHAQNLLGVLKTGGSRGLRARASEPSCKRTVTPGYGRRTPSTPAFLTKVTQADIASALDAAAAVGR